jgi:hypothetical protein
MGVPNAGQRSPPRSPSDQPLRQCAIPGGRFLSIIQLLNQPLDERVFEPRKYLSASHEVFGITLIITWAITLSLYPEQVFEHPARPIIGSFNPCFGWDYPPASYVALVLCSVNVYLTWRYAWLERTRTRLRNPGKLRWYEAFSAYKLDPAGPEDVPSWFLHTGLFVFYVSTPRKTAHRLLIRLQSHHCSAHWVDLWAWRRVFTAGAGAFCRVSGRWLLSCLPGELPRVCVRPARRAVEPRADQAHCFHLGLRLLCQLPCGRLHF